MALTEKQKQDAAKDPGKNTGQSRDQVWDDDSNPTRENLASPDHKNGDSVKSGRDLPGHATAEHAAPKVVERNPEPLPRADDPKNRR